MVSRRASLSATTGHSYLSTRHAVSVSQYALIFNNRLGL